MELKEKYKNKFIEFEATLNGEKESNFHNIRKDAFNTFEQLGIPSLKNESWKYTNLNNLFGRGFEPIVNAELDNTIQIHTFPFIVTNRLVFIDGLFSKQHSHIVDKNVTISNLKTEFKNNNPVLAEYFSKIVSNEKENFVALNTAFANDGAFIHVPEKTVVEHPVLLIFVSSGKKTLGISQPRNIIVVEKSAQVSVIESYQNPNETEAFSNKVTEAYVKENAQLNFYKLMMNEQMYHHISTSHFNIESYARLNAITINFGGALIRNNLNVVFKGPHAEAYLSGTYVLNNKDHVDNHLLIDHAVPNCYSNQLYKGLMDGQSTGVFNGKVFVREDAQKTNAFQSNKNILLSEQATINTKPELEIYADDVKCSHGATIGQMDKNALFYLKTRGISETIAKQIMFQAFVGEVIEKVSIEPLKNYLLEKLHEKFEE